MVRHRNFMLLAGCVGFLSLPVLGQVTYVSRSGELNVFVDPYDQLESGQTQTINVPDSGDLDITDELDGTFQFGGYSKQTLAISQNAYSIVLNGTYSGQFEAYAGTSRYSGELTTTILFDVSDPIPFSLSALTTGEDDGPWTPPASLLSLNGPGGGLIGWQLTGSEGYNNYFTSGILTPGEYTLFVDVGSGFFPFSEFVRNPTITLILPEPANSLVVSVLTLVTLRRRIRPRSSWTR